VPKLTVQGVDWTRDCLGESDVVGGELGGGVQKSSRPSSSKNGKSGCRITVETHEMRHSGSKKASEGKEK